MIWMYMKPTLQLYIHISNSVPSFIPAMYNVLPIAKRHSGIFLCHSILHVALHKHFVLTNSFFFWTILIPGCLFTTKFYYCFIYIELVSFFFFNMDKKYVSMARYLYEMVSSALGLLVQEIQQCHSWPSFRCLCVF